MTKEFDARNAKKSRAVCEAMAERADTGKRIMSEREKLILDMWPKFEDGEYVWFGDEVDGLRGGIDNIDLYERTTNLYDVDVNLIMSFGERLKRPAPKVLDADGVEIKVGDTVYEPNGQSGIVTAVHPSTRCVDLRQDGCDAYAMDTKRLTHTRPDSWERLEEDAEFNDETGIVGGNLDIVRRAKALAGVEVDE